MKTYEQERETFITNNSDRIDDYNLENNAYLPSDLDECWKALSNSPTRVTPSVFFREVRGILNSTEDYTGVDIPDIIMKVFSGNNQHSILQNYFDDVKRCYDTLPDDTLEFTPANRDMILQSNLKMVISTAKRYQNRGLSLEDLISAGNLGLCVAWDKYKPEHNALRERILKTISDSPDEMSKEYVDSIICPHISYGELRERYDSVFNERRVYTKKELERWVGKNIKKAKFSSVAALWIRAYILQELNTSSRLVKKPKSEIDKDYEKYGSYLKETLVQIDPLSDPDDPSSSNIGHKLTDDIDGDMEHSVDEDLERQQFRSLLSRLMSDLSSRDKRVVLKAFGVGLPRAMTAKEISDSERMSVVRVTQVITNAIESMKENVGDGDLEIMLDYLR